jgi:hypothetical protein
MNQTDERLVALRAEIDQVRADLRATTDDREWQRLWARLSVCFRESMELVEHQIYRYEAARALSSAAERISPAGQD